MMFDDAYFDRLQQKLLTILHIDKCTKIITRNK
jgi:hypothetical protein